LASVVAISSIFTVDAFLDKSNIIS
jgi:hypothetical protein